MVDATDSRVRIRGLAALGRSRPAPGGVAAAAVRPSASLTSHRHRWRCHRRRHAAAPQHTQSTPNTIRGINHLRGDRVGAARKNPAGPREVAGVSVRVVLEIVLVLGLGLPERACGRDLGDDSPWPETGCLNVGDRVLRDQTLFVVQVVDRRAIARADVVPLAVQRRRIVNLEEELEQLAVGVCSGSKVISIASACVPWLR